MNKRPRTNFSFKIDLSVKVVLWTCNRTQSHNLRNEMFALSVSFRSFSFGPRYIFWFSGFTKNSFSSTRTTFFILFNINLFSHGILIIKGSANLMQPNSLWSVNSGFILLYGNITITYQRIVKRRLGKFSC